MTEGNSRGISAAPPAFVAAALAALLVLGGCTVPASGPVAITKVNPHHLRPGETAATADRMIEFEHLRLVHGAVDEEDLRERMGHYFTIHWKSEQRNPATVRLEYRQAATGPSVLVKEEHVPSPKSRNVTKLEVVGDDYWDGGPVSQWRVSIVEEGDSVAEYKSFLWR